MIRNRAVSNTGSNNRLKMNFQKNCLNVYFFNRVVEIKEKEIVLENENGAIETFPNDVVFVLIGSDADLTMLKNLGVETKDSKYGEVPVYDEETFETNVSGVYVVGHFTEARHIVGAIEVPKKDHSETCRQNSKMRKRRLRISKYRMRSAAKEILKHQFGYDSFRMNQAAAIETRFDGKRRGGSDADRRRKISVLSNSGADAGRFDGRRFAADRADERSG